jgi:hypothetical protein
LNGSKDGRVAKRAFEVFDATRAETFASRRERVGIAIDSQEPRPEAPKNLSMSTAAECAIHGAVTARCPSADRVRKDRDMVGRHAFSHRGHASK